MYTTLAKTALTAVLLAGCASAGTSISVPNVYQDQEAIDCTDSQCSMDFTDVPMNRALRIDNVTCDIGSWTINQAVAEIVAGGEVLTLVTGSTVMLASPQLTYNIPLNNKLTFYVTAKPEIRLFFPAKGYIRANCTITGSLLKL